MFGVRDRVEQKIFSQSRSSGSANFFDLTALKARLSGTGRFSVFSAVGHSRILIVRPRSVRRISSRTWGCCCLAGQLPGNPHALQPRSLGIALLLMSQALPVFCSPQLNPNTTPHKCVHLSLPRLATGRGFLVRAPAPTHPEQYSSFFGMWNILISGP